MILTDEMLTLAFDFREAELWKKLADSDVFALKLSDGETGYCSVVGFDGVHYALTLYRGQKGFHSYLKMVHMGEQDKLTIHNAFEASTCMDYHACNFFQAAEITDDHKKRVRFFSQVQKRSIPRKHGWPDFMVHHTGMPPQAVCKERDAQDFVEALRAALAVSEQLAVSSLEDLGFDTQMVYPTKQGGKKVPYLIPDGKGSFEWSFIKLPPALKNPYPAPQFPYDIPVRMLKQLPHKGDLLVSFIFFPKPVIEPCGQPFLSPTLLCVDEAVTSPFSVMGTVDFNDLPMEVLLHLAEKFEQEHVVPATIWVCDDRTKALLTDFCKRCDIQLKKKASLPVLEQACTILLSSIFY